VNAEDEFEFDKFDDSEENGFSPKTLQAVLDKHLRIAVYSHKYDIALVLRDKGRNRVTLSKKEAFEHFQGFSKATLIHLDAEKIGMLFSPDCFESVMLGYLNAVLNYILNRSSAYELQQFSKQAWDTCPYYCKSSS
jgi:hypothetical protein